MKEATGTVLIMNKNQIRNITQGMRFMSGECFSEDKGIQMLKASVLLESLTWSFYDDCKDFEKIQVSEYFEVTRIGDNEFEVFIIDEDEGLDALNHLIRSYNLANGISNE
jgi:hypothetical protein